MQTISTKQIRLDLIGFLHRLQQGEKITVIHRSKPLVTLESAEVLPREGNPSPITPGSREAVLQSAELVRTLFLKRAPRLDPNKSVKELYAESIAEEYGLS